MITYQKTIKQPINIIGIGLHSGKNVSMKVLPSELEGITFIRTDLKDNNKILAIFANVSDTKLCTSISNGYANVSTIEHLMAAIRACDIDNLIIEISNSEVPILDGSTIDFVKLFENTGYTTLKTIKKFIKILKPVEVIENNKWVKLTPSTVSLWDLTINFSDKSIGTQHFSVELNKENFIKEISAARTFGFFEEVQQLQKIGLAVGGSLQNAVVIKNSKVLNPEGLRWPNEFVRHKILDAIGDLSLTTYPIIGHFSGYCSGHDLNNKLLHKLFSDRSNYYLSFNS